MPNLIVCELPSGDQIVTTPADCAGQGGHPVDKDHPPTKPDELIPFTLSSGKEVVDTYAHFLADHGKLVDRTTKDPALLTGPGQFICKLPSGGGVIATQDDCLSQGGTVVAKILGP